MDSIEALVEYADNLFDAEKYKDALELLDKVLMDYPSNYEGQDIRIKVLHALGYKDQILLETTERINRNPGDTYALFYRALTYRSSSNLQLAIQDLNRIIKLDKTSCNAYYLKGETNFYAENYEQAIEDLTRALELDSSDVEAVKMRAFCYAKLEEPEKAVKDFSIIIEINPNDIDAYLNRGIGYNILGQFEHALRDYHMVFMMEPDNLIAFERAIEICNDIKDYETMIKFSTEMIDERPNYSDAYLYRGIAHNNMNNVDLAMRDFKKAKELGNEDSKKLIRERF